MTQTSVVVAAPAPEHEHCWQRLPGSVGLFACLDVYCPWCAVCPCCLGSLDVALLAQRGIEGMALYWCPAHQGGGVYDGQ